MPCLSCGTPYDILDRFCGTCGASLALPTVAGHAAGPLPLRNSAYELASFGCRIVAVILDFIAVWSLISVIVMLVPLRLLEDGFQRKGPAILIPIGLCSLVLIYYVLFETLFGATPGKAIAGIQVCYRDGEACNFRAASVRNILRVVDAFAAYLLGFLVAVFSDSRQRIGDLVAGTVVVRRPAATIMRVLLVVVWFGLASGTFVACQVLPVLRHR